MMEECHKIYPILLVLVVSIGFLFPDKLESSDIYFKDFLNLFLDRREGREKEMERNINMQEKHQLVASCMHPTGDLA